MRKLLALGVREDRALAYLMGACLVMFVAQWPKLARQAHTSGEELDALLGANLMGFVFVAPLVFYIVAGIARGIGRLLGGSGTGYGRAYGAVLGAACGLSAAIALWFDVRVHWARRLRQLVFISSGPLALCGSGSAAVWHRSARHERIHKLVGVGRAERAPPL